MSAMPARTAAVRPLPTPQRRPRLRIVRAPAPARSRVPFLLLCLSILVGAMLGALLLNTAMATGAYRLSDMRAHLATLTQDQQQLETSLVGLGSAEQLSVAAGRLGMVPAEGLSYITLADGSIVGPATELISDAE